MDIKEGFKNCGSLTACLSGGVLAFYQFYGKSSNAYEASIVNRVTLVFAKTSIFLSAATSRPCVALISKVSRWFFSKTHIEGLFGLNTVFATNPWHPRHVMSIAAAALAVPSMVHLIYHTDSLSQQQREERDITDEEIRVIAALNLLISRPVLHLGNHLVHRIWKAVKKSG
jgi:hypothetical protein